MSFLGDEYEVENILDSKVRYRKQLYLVRWKGFGPDSDTWEPEENLAHCKAMISSFNAGQQTKRPRTPTRGATPRTRSPGRPQKAQPKTPTKPKTPERQRKSIAAERPLARKALEQQRKDEPIDDRPKQVVMPLPTEEVIHNVVVKDTEVVENSVSPPDNVVVTQRSKLHQVGSPITMRLENGRYPTVSEMRDLAVMRSKAKLGIPEPGNEFSDAEDENDGSQPKAWYSKWWPKWGRHCMVFSLGVVVVGAGMWTALCTSFPQLEEEVVHATPT